MKKPTVPPISGTTAKSPDPKRRPAAFTVEPEGHDPRRTNRRTGPRAASPVTS